MIKIVSVPPYRKPVLRDLGRMAQVTKKSGTDSDQGGGFPTQKLQ